MKVFMYLLMLKINIKCLIDICYIEGLYILCKTHQQNEIRHSKCVVELRFVPFVYVKIYLNQSLKYQVILQYNFFLKLLGTSLIWLRFDISLSRKHSKSSLRRLWRILIWWWSLIIQFCVFVIIIIHTYFLVHLFSCCWKF